MKDNLLNAEEVEQKKKAAQEENEHAVIDALYTFIKALPTHESHEAFQAGLHGMLDAIGRAANVAFSKEREAHNASEAKHMFEQKRRDLVERGMDPTDQEVTEYLEMEGDGV